MSSAPGAQCPRRRSAKPGPTTMSSCARSPRRLLSRASDHWPTRRRRSSENVSEEVRVARSVAMHAVIPLALAYGLWSLTPMAFTSAVTAVTYAETCWILARTIDWTYALSGALSRISTLHTAIKSSSSYAWNRLVYLGTYLRLSMLNLPDGEPGIRPLPNPGAFLRSSARNCCDL